jgi:branched-chain amino acid transport system permease protein
MKSMRRTVVIALSVAAVYPVTTAIMLGLNDYWQNVWLSVMLFTLLSVSWNMLSGMTGYISFGHAAFFAIGAYTAGILAGYASWIGIAAAGFAAAAFGLIFAAPSLRVRGLYFALATLGMAEILHVIALEWEGLTGGAAGLGVRFAGNQGDVLVLMCIVTSLVVAAALTLPSSRFGQRLIALRGDELAAASLGINTSLHKVAVFLASAFTTGLAGALYALWLAFLEPGDVFSTQRLIAIIAMNIFGGIATPLGPVIGALLALLQEAVWAVSPFLHQAFFGLCILVFGLWLPKGIVGVFNERAAGRAAAGARRTMEGDANNTDTVPASTAEAVKKTTDSE